MMYSFNNKFATAARKLAKATAVIVFTIALCIATINLPKSSPSRILTTTIQGNDQHYNNLTITNHGDGKEYVHPSHHLPSTTWNTQHGCMTPELVGEWISVDRSLPRNKFNSPRCCPHQKDDPELKLHALLSSEDKQFCMIPTLIKPGGNACQCLLGNGGTKTLDNSLTWHSSYIPYWDSRQACHLLNHRRILILGDSTLNQAAAVLSEAFHVGGCGSAIEFDYADTLVGREMGAMNRGEHWLTAVERKKFPDIVIIGASAHIHSEANFTIAADEIVDNILFLRELHPEVTVVWKTTSPAGCTDKPSPRHPLDAGQLYEWGSKDWAYWAEFYDRDTRMVKKMVSLGVPILDNRMLYSRSDAHVGQHDCMHFCSPGPLDVMPQLLQMLLERDFKPSTCITIQT